MRSILLSLAAMAALQAAPPAISARIHYTQRLETPDGMTKIVTFEERLLRAPGRVWQERVLPGNGRTAPADHEDHLHPGDLGVAARFLEKDTAGALHLSFIHPQGVRIHAETRDYPEVGFDGSWATAFHILDPQRLEALKPLARKAPRGAQWYGTEDGSQFLRVLWSKRLELPLRIEAGSRDGRKLNVTEIQPGPLPGALPWDRLDGMQNKDYTDLLD